MTEPVTTAKQGNMPVILRIILAVLCLLPFTIGVLVILVIAGAFVVSGFAFKGEEEIWMQAFLAGASVLALPPAILLGIILRFARWKRAANASLVLAIIAGGAVALASGIFRTTIPSYDTESYVTLLMLSIAGIVLGALPPFLHWWNARNAA